MIRLDDEPNLYMNNSLFTKDPLKNGCLEFQVDVSFRNRILLDDLVIACRPCRHGRSVGRPSPSPSESVVPQVAGEAVGSIM